MVVKARVHQVQGNPEEAFVTLSRALTLAEPEGYQRVFLDESEAMRSLMIDYRRDMVRQIQTLGREKGFPSLAYVDNLLSAFQPASSIQEPVPSNSLPRINDLPEPLTKRELDILRLIVAGLSTRDIAEMNVVSINTVKTQVKSIYGKLGAHHRADAIAAALDRSLL
jgi:LuxR family maltose regulon positive regulatory protein